MWTYVGSRVGINPHVLWRVPALSDKQARDEGMNTSQRHIEYLNKNTAVYHTREERIAYMAVVVNTDFVCNTAVAHAMSLSSLPGIE